MLPMFKPAKGEKRKTVMAEVNRDIKATFEETFAENCQSAREQLIQGGVPEKKVEAILREIKAELEQEMIIKAQQLLRKTVLKLAQEEMGKRSTEMPDEPQTGDAPEKSGVSLT
ncbi:MAG: hypothetical protein KBD83_09340 [Gammaproteobacteria bacterium]|nr:hypothetical protein [Gammaproteobacteria bacterium]